MMGSATFQERLARAAQTNDSLLCVGLDPVPEKFPPSMRGRQDIARVIIEFNAGVIDATSDLISVYKANLGFYLAYGGAGIAALEETRRLIPSHIPVILDAKVGDMENTASAYAQGYFDTWNFDAITVNPYLGEDSLAPFLRHANRGVFVVCKTSNPGSGDLQDLPIIAAGGQQPLYLTVADSVASWAERWPATLGLVVGATYPTELATVRRHHPNLPILLPGIGAQAGDLATSVRAGLDATGAGLLISASRSVIFAGSEQEPHWTEGVRAAAIGLRDAVNRVRAAYA